MKGISFVPEKEEKERPESFDIEYSQPESDKPATEKPEPKLPESQPQSRPKRGSSFSAWRRKRETMKAARDAQRAARDADDAARDAVRAAKKAMSTITDTEQAEKTPEPPKHKKKKRPKPLPVPKQKPVPAPTPQPQPKEHTAPIHQKEKAATDLLAAATQPRDFGEHIAPPVTPDEAPDLKDPRGAQGKDMPKVHVPEVLAEPKKNGKKNKKNGKKKGKKKEEIVQKGGFLGVNLIPEEIREEFIVRNRYRELIGAGVIFLVFLFAVYGGMKWYQQRLNTNIAVTEDQIQQVELQIAQYRTLQADAKELSEQLNNVDEVLRQHVYWTPFLQLVEGLTLPTVYYQSMTGSATTGLFTFKAIATDYSQIESQLNTLRNSPYVTSVFSSSASQFLASNIEQSAETTPEETATEQAPETKEKVYVTFSLSIQFDPSLFSHPRSYGNAD
ncbi:MAG: hypothetical protein ABIG66_02280 [Candidatus Kerfeldbacteria bacterium]